MGLSLRNFDYTHFCTVKGIIKKKFSPTFLDLKKAFDSINRQLLLNKLKKLSFDINILNWFTSYLSNRQQLTNIGS